MRFAISAYSASIGARNKSWHASHDRAGRAGGSDGGEGGGGEGGGEGGGDGGGDGDRGAIAIAIAPLMNMSSVGRNIEKLGCRRVAEPADCARRRIRDKVNADSFVSKNGSTVL